ncbi:MAG: AAA family ATPase [Deltaproteobacteria bacterium]|nr:AAA family ATPase [Deltaproteobacteria bacterium]
MGLKIAVAGKGGSGKTTVAVLLAKILSEDRRKVLLVDLDSDPNLASALGIPAGGAPPLVHRKELVAERTGSTGEPGGMFLLNPRVGDLIDAHAMRLSDRVSLLPVGTIESAGEGCFCPQTAFVRALLRQLAHPEEVGEHARLRRLLDERRARGGQRVLREEARELVRVRREVARAGEAHPGDGSRAGHPERRDRRQQGAARGASRPFAPDGGRGTFCRYRIGVQRRSGGAGSKGEPGLRLHRCGIRERRPGGITCS